jgi:undecaprenyl diphosphate synthase
MEKIVILNIALNYGGRDEIISAANAIAQTGADPVDEEGFRKYLDTSGIPDRDLLIRIGGKWRISNFLLWKLAYTEIYFTDVLWPDFDVKALDDAIDWFAARERRFGMTGEQIEGK